MKRRLINCDFLNDSSFFLDMSNKAKLLYFTMFINADDRGFVSNTKTIIKGLEDNDKEFRNEIDLSLLGNDFETALNDLIYKGYLYEFVDNHSNRVHLIRHWFCHNKYYTGWTNYRNHLKKVKLEDGEYYLKNPNDPPSEDLSRSSKQQLLDELDKETN